MTSIIEIFCGIFWILAYYFIIFKGFKDKTFGMPLIALAGNISWEFIFSFVYPQVGEPHGSMQLPVNITWFFLDVVILYQYIKYGHGDFIAKWPKLLFFPTIISSILVAFGLELLIINEFKDSIGIYTAFGANLVISITFIQMFYSRNSLKGQSIIIAISKMLGTFFSYFMVQPYVPHSKLVIMLWLTCFLFDFTYCLLVLNMKKRLDAAK